MKPRLARPVIRAMCLSLVAATAGCPASPPCGLTGDAPIEAAAATPGIAVVPQNGDPFAPGALAVRTFTVEPCEAESPAALRIHAPQPAGEYAVVLFLHGFLLRNSSYDEILTHLAGHGFVVVAPQMYDPGLAALLGEPTEADEADVADRIIAWMPKRLAGVSGVAARTDRLGVAGHSRGGKVAWLAASRDATRFSAIAGIDPTDGTGGPLGGRPRVILGMFPFSIPALIVGAELGGGCAPTGDNHVRFYETSNPPAWHFVALGQGHGDMLADPDADFFAGLCGGGTDRPAMRRLTAGFLTAFFRATLQDDAGAYHDLNGRQDYPSPVTIETK